MKQELTYRYRLYPTKAQEKEILRIAEVARRYYNEILDEKTSEFLKTGIWKRKLAALEEIDDFAWEHGVDKCVLQYAAADFDRAFRKFLWIYRTQRDQYKEDALLRVEQDPGALLRDVDLKGYPEHRSLMVPRRSFTLVPSLLLWQENAVMLPRIGWVRTVFHRLIPKGAEILSCTVLSKSTGKCYLLVRLSMEIQEPDRETIPAEAIGVVFYPGELVVRSDNMPVQVRHTDPDLEKQIEKAYKTLQRRTPGSKRYEEQRRRLARLIEKQVARRHDTLHKAARNLVDAGKPIAIQEPAVKKLAGQHKKAGLDKTVQDEAWYTFLRMLRYKAELAGTPMNLIPRAYPLWRLCSVCNTLHSRSANTKVWLCPSCGAICSKGGNAARNAQIYMENEIRKWKALPPPGGLQ